MAINSKARAHYDDAVIWLQSAEHDAKNGEVNQAVVATGIATASLDLARFCVENHALTVDPPIDEQAPINPKSPVNSGAKVWGPVPP